MKIGIVGTGILGLALGYYLQRRGHTPHFFEQAEQIGGLTCAFDYGSFVWDKFYHVVLPTDTHLIAWFEELGLADQLRWKTTETGFYHGQDFYPLSNGLDMLRFPLLSPVDKVRMAAGILYCLYVAKPEALFLISAQDWLIRYFGARNYEIFWRPLLRAKFGGYAEKVAAIFIWAALTRLYGVRSLATQKESMGYVQGGYDRVLTTLQKTLSDQGAVFHLKTPITAITPGNSHCQLTYAESESSKQEQFDHVVFTGPTPIAQALVPDAPLAVEVTPYLGVVCLVLTLKQPLTPFYILNLADETIPLTGVLEMTNLVDRDQETQGLSLVYLSRYVDSQDALFLKSDADIYQLLVEDGLLKLFPDLKPEQIIGWHVQRARHVQALPLVRTVAPNLKEPIPAFQPPFQVLNASLLTCATLNNNEVVGLAKEIAATFP